MKYLVIVFACLLSWSARATSLGELQTEWALANYETNEAAAESRFQQLIANVEAELAHQPDDPALLIWNGIIKSSWAGRAGGLDALGLVKEARRSLEKALAIDPDALDGSAYTSLGALYYQVPGWPIGFGSDKKARELLVRALELNPDGIDPNYFYADFLASEKEYAAAREHLMRALAAPARPGREIADRGRREEIRLLLAAVEKHI
jgi:tetratricopeptide (TPR) repeat protein